MFTQSWVSGGRKYEFHCWGYLVAVNLDNPFDIQIRIHPQLLRLMELGPSAAFLVEEWCKRCTEAAEKYGLPELTEQRKACLRDGIFN